MNIFRLSMLAKTKDGDKSTLGSMTRRSELLFKGWAGLPVTSDPVSCAIQSVPIILAMMIGSAVSFTAFLILFLRYQDPLAFFLLGVGIFFPLFWIHFINWADGYSWRYNFYWRQIKRAREFCKIITLLEKSKGEKFTLEWTVEDVEDVAIKALKGKAKALKRIQRDLELLEDLCDDMPWQQPELNKMRKKERVGKSGFNRMHAQLLSVAKIPEKHGPFF